jgi:hypothetical protein
MPSISTQEKINISDYLSTVLLRDMLHQTLVAKDSGLSDQQAGSALTGILASIPGLTLGFGVPLISFSAVSFLLSLFTANEIDTIRNQEDESYWLEVKRQIHCALPDSYTDPAWLRDRLARSIENIVPFNNRSMIHIMRQK